MEESLFGPLLVNIDFPMMHVEPHISHIQTKTIQKCSFKIEHLVLRYYYYYHHSQYYYYENWCMGLF